MQDLDIHADVTQTIDNYSIAIQQMIAIARAVDMSAKVLILDEPHLLWMMEKWKSCLR